MASWNEIRDDVTRVANKAIKKTGELADSASLHIKLKVSEAKLSKAYEKLGKLTYKQLKSGDSQAEKISEAMATIDSLRADAKTIKIKLEEAKAAREEGAAEVEAEDDE